MDEIIEREPTPEELEQFARMDGCDPENVEPIEEVAYDIE